MRRRAMHRPAAATLLLCGVATAAAQPVQGKINSVGFEAATGGALNIVRLGCWFPIEVGLQAQGSEHFQGFLGVEQLDIDGDRIEYREGPLAVTAGGIERRAWCYAVTNKESSRLTPSVWVMDERGSRVLDLPLPPLEPLGANSQLILDISETPVTLLQSFNTGAATMMDAQSGARPYYRAICVARLSAKRLPDRWIGLEAADVIVWDEPNPDALSPAQLEAVIGWVRAGGQLVVGIGSASTRISKSPLAAILPIAGAAPPTETRRLQKLQRDFASGGRDASLKSPVIVTSDTVVPGASVILRDLTETGTPIDLVTLRHVGSGRVIAVATALKALSDVVNVRREFYLQLLDLNPLTSTYQSNESEFRLNFEATSLHNAVTEPIQFRRLASFWVLAALAFVAAYVLVSTFGAWAWLRPRNLAHLSWTVFAVAAGAASVIGVGAVSLLRGVLVSVSSVSFVDLEAGSLDARATAYWGYKSPTRTRQTFSVPGEGSFVRPLSSGTELSSEYATPERYAASVTNGTLEGTPLRATLKQFEGFWQGRVDGMVLGKLVARRETGKLDFAESWIQNNLSANIGASYLLYVDPRVRGEIDVVPRAAGVTRRGSAYLGKVAVPPAVNVLAIPLGELPSLQRVTNLGRPTFDLTDAQHQRWQLDPGREAAKEPVLPTLWRLQNHEWTTPFQTLTLGRGAHDQPWSGMLLASTRNLFLANGPTEDFDVVGRGVTTVGLMDVDISGWLTAGSAVLLMLADSPGPAPLEAGGAAVKVREGRTLYRVRMPITYSGVHAASRPAASSPTPQARVGETP
jgi:hypothetical protein